MARGLADEQAYRARKDVAEKILAMRKELERLGVGAVVNTLAATDNFLEAARNVANTTQGVESARRDLEAAKAERDGFDQNWLAAVAQKLSDEMQKLADAREQLSKAELRRRLIELRADRDAIVLTVAKVSIGSVLQSGQQFITLVPADAPLEVEANISGRDDGFVHVGAASAIKFDTFPYSRYGLAHGTVRTISPDSFTAQDDARARGARLLPTPAAPSPFTARASRSTTCSSTACRRDFASRPACR